MTPEIKEMWEKSTITYPRIYKSNHCWRSEPPTCEGLFLKTQDLIYAQKLAERMANKTTTRSIVQLSPMVFTTLSSILGKQFSNYLIPKKENPIAICGYRLPGFIEDPESLTDIAEPFAEENLQILLAPKFWITDSHIGKSFRI
jgi:hypothetical protein